MPLARSAVAHGRALGPQYGPVSVAAEADAAQQLAVSGGSGSITIPNITFTNGIAASHSIRQYVPAVFDGMGLILFGEETLPNGVTFDGTLDAEELDYDGAGGVVTISGLFVQVIPE